MRLSIPVCRRLRHDFLPVYIKKQWREQGCRMTAHRLRVPRTAIDDPHVAHVAAIAEDTYTHGIQRYRDALSREIEIGATPEEMAAWSAERANRLAPFERDEEVPRQKEPSLLFDPARLFSRDIAQAAALTNTVIREGAPPSTQRLLDAVVQRFGAANSADSVALLSSVERAVLHAHLWQTDEDRLPKRYNPDLLIWKFKAEFGIHPVNVARYLLQNLFRLCEVQSHRMGLAPDSDLQSGLPARWLLRDRQLEISFYWGEERRRVQFSQRHDLVLTSPYPTPLFEQCPESSTTDAQIMERHRQAMRLISPLIDLTSTMNYRLESSDGIKTASYPYPNLITVNVALPNTWSDFTAPEKDKITVAQRQAIGLMHCYASCIATAKRLYGDDFCYQRSQILPEPIAVEAVCTDGVFFDFITFQLNTFELPDCNSPNKQGAPSYNVAWVDGNHQLMQKHIPKRSMLRNTRYSDLDMSVFHRLFTKYISGTQASPK